MGRAADLGKRADLLRRVREYVICNGLADLSLRPLAKALGTSDRMLLYYFGSKDRLVAEALAQDEGRPLLFLRQALDSAGAPADAAGMRLVIEELWSQFTAPERRDVLPVTFEVMTASVLNPSRYGPVMRNLLAEWRRLLASAFAGLGMSDERAVAEAGLLVDATLGLLHAPLADGDWDQATAAFQTLLDRLEPAWQAVE
ncbi:TetR/AcrR family transcriptional regulator [Streptomyces sp. NBC_00162]|uniref:TetR/AcrR family transcriptional regulator n=1 Tax=Streptomyces sp. NBC_00162 TaxID=2903629 RepID=UPI00214BFC14|nr:TetR/AcrR family transcriptional regulator [Streptomyces sp. NBC_00162]UUU43989.1 TetR/AcrR family transcriptional regulator [Streptomyces sp. NBC_00162]